MSNITYPHTLPFFEAIYDTCFAQEAEPGQVHLQGDWLCARFAATHSVFPYASTDCIVRDVAGFTDFHHHHRLISLQYTVNASFATCRVVQQHLQHGEIDSVFLLSSFTISLPAVSLAVQGGSYIFLGEAYGHENLKITNGRGSPQLFGWYNLLLCTIA